MDRLMEAVKLANRRLYEAARMAEDKETENRIEHIRDDLDKAIHEYEEG